MRGSGIGTLPAPVKRGAADDNRRGKQGTGPAGAGKPVRGRLDPAPRPGPPEWTGARLPEETILNSYSRQAESAPRPGRGPAEAERVREGILHRHRHVEVGSGHGRTGTGGVGERRGARAAGGDRARHRRARGGGPRRPGLPVLRRPRAAGGRAGAGKDDAHQVPRAGARPRDLADPVHARPDARGHHRDERARPGGDAGAGAGAESAATCGSRRGRCSRTSCWRTKSTAPRPRPSPRSWRRCRSRR